MYFSKITIDSRKLIRDDKIYKYIDMSDHKLIWRLFQDGSNKKRDFIFYSVDSTFSSEKAYYLISERKPFSKDDWLCANIKEYNPIFKKGQKLGFKTRLNPIIAKKVGDNQKSKKHDVCMDAKFEGKKAGLEGLKLEQFIERQTIEWLKTRAEKNGFQLQDSNLSVARYVQIIIPRQKKSHMKFSSIDYEGILEITEPEKFKNIVFNGLGRAKGFGCGLFLLKRL